MVLIANKTVTNVFKEPRNDSERISQVKIGEPLEELNFEGDFVYVKSLDEYEGWVVKNGLSYYNSIQDFFGEVVLTFKDPFSVVISISNFRPIIVPMGSFLPLVRKEKEQFIVRLPNGEEAISLVGEPSNFNNKLPFRKTYEQNKILETAENLLGVPYLWGGTTPLGLDCSGFVQLIFRVCGHNLKRDAHLQFSHDGEFIEHDKIKAGDLVFFSVNGKYVDHVAILISQEEIIHSTKKYGKVVRESLDRLRNYVVGYKSII